MKNNIRTQLNELRSLRNNRMDSLLGEILPVNKLLVLKILNHINEKGNNAYTDLINKPLVFLSEEEVKSHEYTKLISNVANEFNSMIEEEKISIIDKVKLIRENRIINDQRKIDKINDGKHISGNSQGDNQQLEQGEINNNLFPMLGEELTGSGLTIFNPVKIETIEDLEQKGIIIAENISSMLESFPANLPVDFRKLTIAETEDYLPKLIELSKSISPIDDLKYFVDFIAGMKRNTYFNEIDDGDLKKISNITEKSISKGTKHHLITLKSFYRSIINSFPNMFGRNIGIDIKELESFRKQSFKENNTVEGILNTIVSFLKISIELQNIYVKRMEDIVVPYYNNEIEKTLESFLNIQLKLMNINKTIGDFSDTITEKKLHSSAKFLLSVKGYMGGKGLLTDKQESSVISCINEITSTVQFMIDNDTELGEILLNEVDGVDGVDKTGQNVNKITTEILVTLYDRPSTKIGNNISQYVNFKFISIDSITQTILENNHANFWHNSSEFINKIIENPDIIDIHYSKCPEMFDVFKKYNVS